MQNLSFSLGLFVVLGTAGCSFEVGAKAGPKAPAPVVAQPASSAPTAPTAVVGAPTPASTRAPVAFGRVSNTSPAPAPTTDSKPSSGVPVLIGTNAFGQGTPDASGWKGSFFLLPPATQKLPALATSQPNGLLFAKELNVVLKPMTGGFPGIDATRNEDFAIRWEAPLIVDSEADYTFRILSDDGSNLLIDNTLIVENDSQHTIREKSGPVHLVKGTHLITVDYFQATGPVALQLFCKKAGGAETICPTRLP